jgi:hypothetical protein
MIVVIQTPPYSSRCVLMNVSHHEETGERIC